MICRIYDVPGGTLEQYDDVDQKVGPEKPEGVHLHVAGMTDQGAPQAKQRPFIES